LNYQQSALAHGYIESFLDAQLTFDDMCSVGTAPLCRNYFVVLTLQGYATHAIYEIEDKKQYMMQDYIVLGGHSQEVAEQMMLKDLERIFRKNDSSLEKFGFPKPDQVPTELELQQTQWINEERQNEKSSGMIFTPKMMLYSILQTYPRDTLKKGDRVIMGTPGGVALVTPRWKVRLANLLGFNRFTKLKIVLKAENNRFLKQGDRVTISGEWLGEIDTTIQE
jgi:hypothetical protein